MTKGVLEINNRLDKQTSDKQIVKFYIIYRKEKSFDCHIAKWLNELC